MVTEKKITAVVTAFAIMATPAFGRDDPIESIWSKADPEIVAWFRALKMPDTNIPCCGEADAYWADSYTVDSETGNWVAIITDTRPDAERNRKHIPPGTKIVVPKWKLYGQSDPENPTIRKPNPGNPTGHGIIFINPYAADKIAAGEKPDENNEIDGFKVVFCYIQPGGG